MKLEIRVKSPSFIPETAALIKFSVYFQPRTRESIHAPQGQARHPSIPAIPKD